MMSVGVESVATSGLTVSINSSALRGGADVECPEPIGAGGPAFHPAVAATAGAGGAGWERSGRGRERKLREEVGQGCCSGLTGRAQAAPGGQQSADGMHGSGGLAGQPGRRSRGV